MDEQKKYTSTLIPRQEDASAKRASAPLGGMRSSGDTTFSGAMFAEVDVDFNSAYASEKAIRFFSSVTPPEPIEKKEYDPIRMRFNEMRRLASERPFVRGDAELFYRQAKFMEDFTDDFEDSANFPKFLLNFPQYQRMGYEQLRTYFTWRTKARRGDLQPIPGSYAFIYVYELLCNIGVADPLEGLAKLVDVWNICLRLAPALGSHMPQWLKDYHIYYDLPHSFADFAKEYGLLEHYSTNFIFDKDIGNDFDIWNRISGYSVITSKFIKDGNEQHFKDCFLTVIEGIRRLCAKNNIRIEDLFIYSIGRKMPWAPFKSALFFQWMRQPDRKVVLPGQERYYCKSNKWSAKLPIYYSTQKDFVGYIIKKTEACMRQTANYKYKLKAEPYVRDNRPLGELKAIEGAGIALDAAIENAVQEYYINLTRTVVTVDLGNLDRIREEARGTQEKLIVQEELGVGGAEVGVRGAELGVRREELGVEREELEVRSEELRVKNEELGITNSTELNYQLSTFNSQLPSQLSTFNSQLPLGGWADLKEALSSTEVLALALVLRGGRDIKAFADENGVMLEVLADSINEKASDCIGDSILEVDGGMVLYDEYRDKVAEMIEQ